MQQNQLQKQNRTDLKKLEHNLQLSVLALSAPMAGLKPGELSEFIQPLAGSTGFGILVCIDTRHNFIIRASSLLCAVTRINLLSTKLKRQGHRIIGQFGIYPAIDDPVTIFELNSPADRYVNRYVLPTFSKGFNGQLRKLIMKLVKCHPSSAGIILIARKNDAVC